MSHRLSDVKERLMDSEPLIYANNFHSLRSVLIIPCLFFIILFNAAGEVEDLSKILYFTLQSSFNFATFSLPIQFRNMRIPEDKVEEVLPVEFELDKG